MNSELEVLKKIWENKGEAQIRLISNQTGMGLDFTRFLCQSLLRKGWIKPVRRKRDWYKITFQGKKELGLRKLRKVKTSPLAVIESRFVPEEIKLKLSKKIKEAISSLKGLKIS